MITPSKLAAASAMNGFKNFRNSSFSVTIPSQNISAGHFVSAIASTPLNNSNSISQVQVQYSSLDSQYFVIYGLVNTYWNSNSYEIETFYYFDATNLYVFIVVVNQTGGTITIPTIPIICRANLFKGVN